MLEFLTASTYIGFSRSKKLLWKLWVKLKLKICIISTELVRTYHNRSSKVQLFWEGHKIFCNPPHGLLSKRQNHKEDYKKKLWPSPKIELYPRVVTTSQENQEQSEALKSLDLLIYLEIMDFFNINELRIDTFSIWKELILIGNHFLSN